MSGLKAARKVEMNNNAASAEPTTNVINQTPQETIRSLMEKPEGFTVVDVARARGKSDRRVGPFQRSVDAAARAGLIVATKEQRGGKFVYRKGDGKPVVAKKVDVTTKSVVAGMVEGAVGRGQGQVLATFFESLAELCRKMG